MVYCLIYIYIYIVCKSPDTQGLKATSRCGLQLFYSKGHCHLLHLGLKQGCPLYNQSTSQILCSKCNDRDSNPHSAYQTAKLGIRDLNRSVMTRCNQCWIYFPFFPSFLSGPCEQGGTCVNIFGSYLCNCLPGFSGTRCELNINECSSHPCVNGATCLDLRGLFRCICVRG